MSVAPPIVTGNIPGRIVPTPGARFQNTIRPTLAKFTQPGTALTSEIGNLIPAIYSQSPEFPGLLLTGLELVNKEGLLSDVNVIWEGCPNGLLPQPFWENDFSLQSLTTTATAASTGDKITMEVMYLAPTTSYEWIENSRPQDTPRYSQMQTAANPLQLSNIIRIQITDNATGAPGFVPYSDFTAAWNSLRTGYVILKYNPKELIPGYYWHCSATIANMAFGSTGS